MHSTVPGYDLAALAIFAVPWGLGTVIGLSARAIETLPIFPTYPNAFTAAEVGAGYVMPYTLSAILGPGGAIGMFLCLFMAVTSTVSSSMIAVSSILSFDVYLTYVNPRATDKQVVRASHLGVLFHGVFITGISLALSYGGANMSWLNYCSPVLTSPGVFPLFFTLMWSGQTRAAAVIAPILGLATGIAVWLSTAYSLYGEVTILSTVKQAPALYGAIGSLFSPILYSVVISYIKPETFDWREFLLTEPRVREDSSEASSTLESMDFSTPALDSDISEKSGDKSTAVTAVVRPEIQTRKTSLDNVVHPFDEQTLRYLRKWYKIAWTFLIVLVLVTFVAWPLPLYRDWIFTKKFFSGWVSVAIIWQFFAFFAVVAFPVWDGKLRRFRVSGKFANLLLGRQDLITSVKGIRRSLGNMGTSRKV